MDNDLISRQAALDALLELVEVRRTWISTEAARKEISGIDASMCAIHDLPSTERRGRWEFNIDDERWSWDYPYMCDQCGEWVEKVFKFCPSCGAKMEGEEE